MKLSTFLVVSNIGRLPGTYLLTVQGAKFRDEDYWQFAIVTVASAVVLLIAYLYREKIFYWLKHRHDPQPRG